MWLESKGLGQRAGSGDQDRLHPPLLQNFLPAAAELDRRLELVDQVIAIEVGAAIHEHQLPGIQLPDDVPSPVIVGKQAQVRALRAQEFHGLLREQFRLARGLVTDQVLSSSRGKDRQQNQNCGVESHAQVMPRRCRPISPELP